MPTLSTKERKCKFNKLFNDLNIKLIKGNRSLIVYIKQYINNAENLTKRSFDLSIKNKQISFCFDLTFGVLSLSSYADIESVSIISFAIDGNIY